MNHLHRVLKINEIASNISKTENIDKNNKINRDLYRFFLKYQIGFITDEKKTSPKNWTENYL